MAQQENYDYIASRVDIDSLIDWMIMEGYSTNWDVHKNLRYFKSTENGNKWQMAFYDLDQAFFFHTPFDAILSSNQQHTGFTETLMANPQFRQQFLERLSYAMETTLSDANVLALIDTYEELLAPEVARERERWYSAYDWRQEVENLRLFITEPGHLKDIVSSLEDYIGLTEQERERYFANWAS